VRRRDEVMGGLTKAIARLDRDELCRRCDAVGVPAGPILDVQEVLASEQVAARDLVVNYDHPQIGSFSGLRIPFRFMGFDDPVASRPPLLGEHTEQVLSTRLGLSPEAIEALRAAHAI
jgi:crotonobetainyl-CoA:carnitine CoA-transferase CaiB-like acyl-CoA transferase